MTQGSNEDSIIYLDKNESPFPLPEHIRKEMGRISMNLDFHHYPEDYSQSLREKIGKRHGLSMENVIVGNGSDQVISFILTMWRKKRFVISPPTFGMYRFFMEGMGLKYTEVQLNNRFQLSMEKLIGISNAAYVVCSPNNPTGNDIEMDPVIKLLETGSPVIVDEAYADFSDQDFTGLLAEYSNLVVLRTFSKVFGLSGLRVGYALASRETIDGLISVTPPYAIGSFQSEVAGMVLDNIQYILDSVRRIKSERERIVEGLSHVVFPTNANFYLLNLDMSSYLERNGVIARKLDGRLSKTVRITVGTREENDRILELAEEFLHNL